MVRRCTVPPCFGERGATTARRSEPIEEEVATVARALAHPARVAIIERFTDGRPKLTKELVAPSGLAPSTMSEHLRILRESGIIVARHDGPGIWYCLCPDRLATFADTIHQLLDRRRQTGCEGTKDPDDVRRTTK